MLMIVMRLGSARAASWSMPRASDDLEGVVDDRRPESEALPRLVKVGRERRTCRDGGSRPAGRSARGVRRPPGGRCRARRSRGRSRGSPRVAGPPAAVDVADERGPADGARTRHDGRRTSGSSRGCERGAGMSTAPARRAPRPGPGRADTTGRPVDRRAGARQEVDRPVAEHLDADLGEDPQRCSVEVSTSSAERISTGRYGLRTVRHGSWAIPPDVRRGRRRPASVVIDERYDAGRAETAAFPGSRWGGGQRRGVGQRSVSAGSRVPGGRDGPGGRPMRRR